MIYISSMDALPVVTLLCSYRWRMAVRVESVQARERLNDSEKEDVNVTGCESI